MSAILLPLVCSAALAVLIVVGQAAGAPPLPPRIVASLEDLAVHVGLIQAPPTLWSTPTAEPLIVYLEPLEGQTTQAIPATVEQTSGASPSPTDTPTLAFTNTVTAPPSATFGPATISSATLTRMPSPTPTRTPSRTPTPVPPTSAPGATDTATSTDVGPPPPSPTLVPPSATPDSACDPSGNPGYEDALLDLINQERQNQGLPAYALNGQLRAAARGHSQDMACNDFFSHTGSDGSSVGDRVSVAGYSWSWVGENIFATSSMSSAAAQQAFEGWMNSSGHRDNILSANFTEIGIGYAYNPDSTYGSYFTAVFARP